MWARGRRGERWAHIRCIRPAVGGSVRRRASAAHGGSGQSIGRAAAGSVAVLDRRPDGASPRPSRATALAPVRVAPVSFGATVSAAPPEAAPAPARLPVQNPEPTPVRVPGRAARGDTVRLTPDPAGSAAPRVRQPVGRGPASSSSVLTSPSGALSPNPPTPGYRMGRWARLGMTITVTAAIVVGALTLIGHGGGPQDPVGHRGTGGHVVVGCRPRCARAGSPGRDRPDDDAQRLARLGCRGRRGAAGPRRVTAVE